MLINTAVSKPLLSNGKKDTKIAFSLSCLFILLGPIFFPKYLLFFFAPYLVLCFYRYSRYLVLWRAIGCGLLLDLLSSGTYFGLASLNYCLVSWLLYGQTRNFFEDKLSTLPLMTFLFSFFSTLIFLLLTFFCGSNYKLSWSWVATDLLGMSLADSIYAFLFFTLPPKLLQKVRRIKLMQQINQ